MYEILEVYTEVRGKPCNTKSLADEQQHDQGKKTQRTRHKKKNNCGKKHKKIK